MQQIERYGVIALLFLLVTIVVVALWDGGDTAHAGEERAQVEEPAAPKAVERERRDRYARPNQARVERPEERRTAVRSQNPMANPRRVTLDPNRNSPSGQNQARQRPRAGVPVHQNPTAAAAYQRQPSTPAFSPAQRQPGSTERYAQPVRQGNPGAARTVPAGTVPHQNVVQTPQRENVARVREERPRETVRQGNLASRSKTPQVMPSGRTYRVQPGDSLERIARRELGNGQRWKEIQVLNGIARPETIAVGAVLQLPAGGAVPTKGTVTKNTQPTRSKASGNRRSAGSTYTVQSGDVLTRIAQKELGSAQRYLDIVAANPGLNPDKLTAGMVLKMPQRGAGTQAKRTQSQPVAQADRQETRYVVH